MRVSAARATCFLLRVLWVPCLALASPALANCEAGAYLIHTRAEYADLDEDADWFFRVTTREDGSFIVSNVATGRSPQRLSPLYSRAVRPAGPAFHLVRGKTSCRPFASKVRPDEMIDLLQGRIPVIDDCWTASAGRGYAIYRQERNELSFGVPVGVEADAPPADREALEQELARRVLKLGLSVEHFRAGPGPPSDGRREMIGLSDIQGVRYGHTLVGSRQSGLLLSVAVLRLRNLDRLFPARRYLQPEHLADRLADFPVLFLRRPGGEPVYIGDGSWCSSLRISGSARAGERFLGPLDRFTITNGWDFDRDGTPELVEVNEAVVYWLPPDGRLLVLDYQLGC